jgi:hypothetical protein
VLGPRFWVKRDGKSLFGGEKKESAFGRASAEVNAPKKTTVDKTAQGAELINIEYRTGNKEFRSKIEQLKVKWLINSKLQIHSWICYFSRIK